MGSWTDRLISKQLIDPPKFISCNVHYECLMGSVAYGASNDTSDCDLCSAYVGRKGVIYGVLQRLMPKLLPQVRSGRIQNVHCTRP